MLTGERTTVIDHEVRGSLDKFAVSANATFALQIEADAHVNATMSEVSVERPTVAVFIHQLSNVAQIRSKFLGADGRIVPPFPSARTAHTKSTGACPYFAHLPTSPSFLALPQPHHPP